MQNQDSKISNKLTIIAIITATYIALLALSYSIQDKNDITRIIISSILILGFIPIVFFVLYIIFLPLRFKSKNQNTFYITDSYDYVIDNDKIDSLFDKGANLLVPTYIWGFIYVLTHKFVSLIYKNDNWIGSIIVLTISVILTRMFLLYIIGARKVETDYHLGDGFLWALKSLLKKFIK